MITSIHGILEACRADQAIIRVGGFSVRVFAPALTLNGLNENGKEVTLYTHFQVREDGMAVSLYVIVEYGTRVSEVANNLSNAVRYSVERTLGLPVVEVNVNVQGIHVSGSGGS